MSKQKRILVVDDDVANRKLMRAMLTKGEYDCYCVDGGDAALKAVAMYNLDLFLVDVMMPNMDGFELTRQLKANSKTQNIPIILVTALSDPETRRKGLEAGADEFFTKPVDSMKLLKQISNLLGV